MSYLITILTLSFALEGLFSLLIPMNGSIFIPLFTVVALVSIYPYFMKYDSPFFKICITVGFCYDIIYTNTLFIHAILFWILGHWISLLYKRLSNRFINFFLILLLSIIGYRCTSFLFLIITNYITFYPVKLLYSITSSLCSNILYALILYGILQLLRKYKKVHLYQ